MCEVAAQTSGNYNAITICCAHVAGKVRILIRYGGHTVIEFLLVQSSEWNEKTSNWLFTSTKGSAML